MVKEVNKKLDRMERFFRSLDQVDFQNQKMIYNTFRLILVCAAVISFAIGYYFQDFSLTVKLYIACLVIVIILFVPGWEHYKNKGIKWLEPKDPDESEMIKTKKGKTKKN